jgi:hypothetical protein
MTAHEQQIAIAIACGWVAHEAVNEHGYPQTYWHGGRDVLPYLPDYTEDLNACHAAEEAILTTERLKIEFKDTLTRILPGENPTGWNWRYQWHASAAQRCEALLRAIGEWTGRA